MKSFALLLAAAILLSFWVGWMAAKFYASLRRENKAIGKLKVAIDPEDGQHYFFLELSPDGMHSIVNGKRVAFEVEFE